jgi:hypothetical protein
MRAASQGSAALARMQLMAGASVGTACSQWHMTALYYAAELCIVDMLNVLLEEGADATAVGVNGNNSRYTVLVNSGALRYVY